MKALRSSETSDTIYQSARLNIAEHLPEELRLTYQKKQEVNRCAGLSYTYLYEDAIFAHNSWVLYRCDTRCSGYGYSSWAVP